MNNAIGRLLTRGSDDTNTQVDLIIGAAFKNKEGVDRLKPDRIYEIRECLGVLTLVDIGASEVKQPDYENPEKTEHMNWTHSFKHLATYNGVTYLLTEDEYAEMLTTEETQL